MSAKIMRVFTAAALILVFVCSNIGAYALTATVVMKVSRVSQDSVINVGEDLSIDINIEGVTPSTYRWYFNDASIAGADQMVYSIDRATVEDAGNYRVEAFDDTGKMLVSMAFNVRVIDKTIPKSGDNTVSAWIVCLIIMALTSVMGIAIYRKRRCA